MFLKLDQASVSHSPGIQKQKIFNRFLKTICTQKLSRQFVQSSLAKFLSPNKGLVNYKERQRSRKQQLSRLTHWNGNTLNNSIFLHCPMEISYTLFGWYRGFFVRASRHTQFPRSLLQIPNRMLTYHCNCCSRPTLKPKTISYASTRKDPSPCSLSSSMKYVVIVALWRRELVYNHLLENGIWNSKESPENGKQKPPN